MYYSDVLYNVLFWNMFINKRINSISYLQHIYRDVLAKEQGQEAARLDLYLGEKIVHVKLD